MRTDKKIKTAVFYSFKGVASFSSLAMATASVLASRGHKVVVIDLDLEGLGDGIEGEPGLVDYFYDRAYGLAGTYQTSISDIAKEIPVSDSTGKLFSIPKGATTLDYISKVDDLSTTVVTDEGKTLWQSLFDDLKGYLDPDLILVSSPSGLNKWAAVAVLDAASKVLVPEADLSAPQVLLDMMASAGVPGPIWFPLPVTRHSTIADLICIQ